MFPAHFRSLFQYFGWYILIWPYLFLQSRFLISHRTWCYFWKLKRLFNINIFIYWHNTGMIFTFLYWYFNCFSKLPVSVKRCLFSIIPIQFTAVLCSWPCLKNGKEELLMKHMPLLYLWTYRRSLWYNQPWLYVSEIKSTWILK